MLEKIWPNSFTYWKVISPKRNAILCEVSKLGKELGLFWKFQSANSEFAFLPAVFPRNEKKEIKMTSSWMEDRALLVDFGRKPRAFTSHNKVICSRKEAEELYRFRFNFKEGEAKTYAELLKQSDSGTEDYDDTIAVQKIEPSLTARLIPIFVLGFWLVVLWFLYVCFLN